MIMPPASKIAGAVVVFLGVYLLLGGTVSLRGTTVLS